MYGPKGVGGLYVRRRPRVRLEAQINGGGQERGLRSGTLPTPLVVGFGAACELAGEEMEADHAWVTHLSEVRPALSRLLPSSCQGLSGDLRVCNAQRLYDGITSQLEEVKVNGCPDQRYPGNTNISFAWIEGESLLMAMKKVAVSSVSCFPQPLFSVCVCGGGGGRSSPYLRVLGVALTAGLCTWQGSACTSASLEPSYVLRALGVDDDLVREPTARRPVHNCDSHLMRECCSRGVQAHSSIRYGFGRFTTEEEVDWAVKLTVTHVQRLRDMSPLYEMHLEGIDINSIQWSQH